MDIKEWVKKRPWNKYSLVGYSLLELDCVVCGMLIVTLVPSIMEINILWLGALFVLLAIIPFYEVFKK